MNGAALDLNQHAEHKDVIGSYARYDIVYVMLDKRIDHLSDEIKDVKGEIKDLSGEINNVRNSLSGDTNNVRNSLTAEISNMRTSLTTEISNVRTSLTAEINNVRTSLSGEIKDLRTELLGEIGKTNQRIDALAAQTTVQMVSMKTWGIGLLVTILLVVLAPHVISLLG